MDIIPVFRSSLGLTNRVNKVRVPVNSDTAAMHLASAVNIIHDLTGRPFRRQGTKSLFSGPFQSVFAHNDVGLVIWGGDLYLINFNLEVTKIRSGLTDVPMWYVYTTQGIFYSNGYENGVVKMWRSYPWPVGTYIGPLNNKKYSPAPVGKHLAIFGGRMLIAVGRYIYYSEPYDFGLFDLTQYLPMDSDVRMIKVMTGGLFVSSSTRVEYLHGDDITQLEPNIVETTPAFEGSCLQDLIKGQDLGLEDRRGCAVWGSQEGIIAGGPDGVTYNISNDIYDPPQVGTRGASIYTDSNIIQCIF